MQANDRCDNSISHQGIYNLWEYEYISGDVTKAATICNGIASLAGGAKEMGRTERMAGEGESCSRTWDEVWELPPTAS